MTSRMIQNRAKKYLALQEKATEIERQLEEIRKEFKDELDELDAEGITAGGYLVRWYPVKSSRFDSAAFKTAHGGLYAQYVKPVSYMRFTVTSKAV